MEELLSGRPLKIPEPQRGVVHFVLVLVRGDDLNQLQKRRADVARLALRTNALVEFIAGPIVQITFATLPFNTSSLEHQEQNRRQFVSELSQTMSDGVAILHGVQPGVTGNIALADRFSFGTFFEKHADLLRTLMTLKSGELKEWSAGDAIGDRQATA
jgi:hypothetical protein